MKKSTFRNLEQNQYVTIRTTEEMLETNHSFENDFGIVLVDDKTRTATFTHEMYYLQGRTMKITKLYEDSIKLDNMEEFIFTRKMLREVCE